MKKEDIIKILSKYPHEDVNRYAGYCLKLATETDRSGKLKNPWMQKLSVDALAEYFISVKAEGLTIDGVHITIQSTGISYDYQAYKNKMLLAYPESVIDISLIYTGDTFEFSKESGDVQYYHKLSDPFSQKEANIIGGYCVIKNTRGQFLTTLSRDDFEKHRKVAKTDYIWKAWYPEMCMKTLMKKACRTHYSDEFKGIEEMDNKQNDIKKVEDIGKTEIDKLTEEIIDALQVYQGDDKDSIRKKLNEAKKSGKFTESFAKKVLYEDLNATV